MAPKDRQITVEKSDQGGNNSIIAPIFGEVALSWPKTDTVYTSRFGSGGKSTKAIDYSVEIVSCGLKVDGTIYGRLEEKPDGYQITFAASLPKGMSGPKECTEALIAHVETAAVRWAAYDKATDAATARLTDQKPTETGMPVRPDMKPRLVKLAKPTGQTGAQTVQ